MAQRFSKDELTYTLDELMQLRADVWGLDLCRGTSQVGETDPDREAKLTTLAEIHTIGEIMVLVQDWQNERLHIRAQYKRMTQRNEGDN